MKQLDPSPVDRARDALDLAAAVLSLVATGWIVWTILPEGVRTQAVAPWHARRARRADTARREHARRQLASEAWHIRRTLDAYNETRDSHALISALGLESTHLDRGTPGVGET